MTQVIDPVLTPNVVEGADVRVVQHGNRPGFALEPLLQIRVTGDMLGEDFDGGAVQASVFGLVDLSHAARAEGAWIS